MMSIYKLKSTKKAIHHYFIIIIDIIVVHREQIAAKVGVQIKLHLCTISQCFVKTVLVCMIIELSEKPVSIFLPFFSSS